MLNDQSTKKPTQSSYPLGYPYDNDRYEINDQISNFNRANKREDNFLLDINEKTFRQ